MTIKMIVDECDKYELPDITDTFSFNFSTADSWVRSRIGWQGRRMWKFKGVRTKSNQFNVFFLPLSTYTLNILGLGEGVCEGPNLLIPAGSTIVQYTF
jgi:hypothetical protein